MDEILRRLTRAPKNELLTSLANLLARGAISTAQAQEVYRVAQEKKREADASG